MKYEVMVDVTFFEVEAVNENHAIEQIAERIYKDPYILHFIAWKSDAIG